jgi:hypothetical protein
MIGLAGSGDERLRKVVVSGSIRRKRPWSYTAALPAVVINRMETIEV